MNGWSVARALAQVRPRRVTLPSSVSTSGSWHLTSHMVSADPGRRHERKSLLQGETEALGVSEWGSGSWLGPRRLRGHRSWEPQDAQGTGPPFVLVGLTVEGEGPWSRREGRAMSRSPGPGGPAGSPCGTDPRLMPWGLCRPSDPSGRRSRWLNATARSVNMPAGCLSWSGGAPGAGTQQRHVPACAPLPGRLLAWTCCWDLDLGQDLILRQRHPWSQP